jgi:hypothetical protein
MDVVHTWGKKDIAGRLADLTKLRMRGLLGMNNLIT